MEFIHKNTFHLPASQCSLSCKTPVCSKTLNMCMHFARIVMTTVKCGNVFWEVKKSILMMYWAVVSFVRCHPGIAQTLHGRLAQKLKDFCMYISNSCSMHFLRQWSFFFVLIQILVLFEFFKSKIYDSAQCWYHFLCLNKWG